jgi:hypothetical protein
MTSEQVVKECQRLFGGREYEVQMALQWKGRDRLWWTGISPFTGLFRTQGDISPSRTTGRPLCIVRYDEKGAGGWSPTGTTKSDVRLNFDGRILYSSQQASPLEKEGLIMIVDGGTLLYTEFFYWRDNREKKPDVAAGIHQRWGTYRPIR